MKHAQDIFLISVVLIAAIAGTIAIYQHMKFYQEQKRKNNYWKYFYGNHRNDDNNISKQKTK